MIRGSGALFAWCFGDGVKGRDTPFGDVERGKIGDEIKGHDARLEYVERGEIGDGVKGRDAPFEVERGEIERRGGESGSDVDILVVDAVICLEV